MKFGLAIQAFGTTDFETVLKKELIQHIDSLPLQQGLSRGSMVIDKPVTILIHRFEEFDDLVQVKAGIFYHGAIAGCNCSDDPYSDNETTEYCEVMVRIDKESAAADVMLLNGGAE